MSTESTTPKTVEGQKAHMSPIYPLIEFPEGIDLHDCYGEVRFGMVVAHVSTLSEIP
jgi:hypothetical protein